MHSSYAFCKELKIELEKDVRWAVLVDHAHASFGNFKTVIECYEFPLDIAREIGDREG